MDIETKVLLVDDHLLFRKRLRSLLEDETNVRVVGEATGGAEAIEMARELSPDVIVMDITMPNSGGIDVTRRILSESPQCKVIVLSSHSGKWFVEDVFKAGAAAYILKDNVPEDLLKGVRAVMEGEGYLSQSIASLVLLEFKRRLDYPEESHKERVMTTKENEVLRLLVEGACTEDIASILQVSVETLESIRGQIMNKLDAFTVEELTEGTPHEDLIKQASQVQELELLSRREFEILSLLEQGLSNKEIALTLFLSTETVKKHLYNTYQKLHVNNRVSALFKAKELGLLPSE